MDENYSGILNLTTHPNDAQITTDGKNTKKKNRQKISFTKAQTDKLKEAFIANEYMTSETLSYLSEKLNVEQRHILSWFENKRIEEYTTQKKCWGPPKYSVDEHGNSLPPPPRNVAAPTDGLVSGAAASLAVCEHCDYFADHSMPAPPPTGAWSRAVNGNRKRNDSGHVQPGTGDDNSGASDVISDSIGTGDSGGASVSGFNDGASGSGVNDGASTSGSYGGYNRIDGGASGGCYAKIHPSGSTYARIHPSGSTYTKIHPSGSTYTKIHPSGSTYAKISATGCTYTKISAAGSSFTEIGANGCRHTEISPSGSSYTAIGATGSGFTTKVDATGNGHTAKIDLTGGVENGHHVGTDGMAGTGPVAGRPLKEEAAACRATAFAAPLPAGAAFVTPLPAGAAFTAPLPAHAAFTAPLPAHAAFTAPLPAHAAFTAPLPAHAAFTAPLPAHAAFTAPLPVDAAFAAPVDFRTPPSPFVPPMFLDPVDRLSSRRGRRRRRHPYVDLSSVPPEYRSAVSELLSPSRTDFWRFVANAVHNSQPV